MGEVELRRQDLREKIARLGEVNPGAATELAQEEERYTFLKTQEHDLQHSLQDLQNTITNQKKSDIGNTTHNFRCGIHQLIVSFERKEACDFSNNGGVQRYLKLFSDFFRVKLGT